MQPFIKSGIGYIVFLFRYPHPHGSSVPFSAENFSLNQIYRLLKLEEGDYIYRRYWQKLLPRSMSMKKNGVLKPDYYSVPDMENETVKKTSPALLFFSNSPEILNSGMLPGGKAVAARAALKPGISRIMVSHINKSRDFLSLFLAIRNTGPKPSVLTITKKSSVQSNRGNGIVMSFLEAGAKAQLDFQNDSRKEIVSLKKNGIRKIKIAENFLQGAVGIFEIETDKPLVFSVVVTAGDTGFDAGDLSRMAVLPPDNRIMRGVFARPDYRVGALYNPADGGIKKYTFGGGRWSDKENTMTGCSWLEGLDETGAFEKPLKVVNKGNYGSVYDFTLKINNPPGSKYRRVMLVAVGAGGEGSITAAGKQAMIPPGGAVVLFNETVDGEREYKLEYNYVANSFAPVHLLAIPFER
ncbi:MAG: hypothetical protein M1269_05310 [Chloroflexi bacterium]|nr:hypothetical protein [Chloroflexota bacterium]